MSDLSPERMMELLLEHEQYEVHGDLDGVMSTVELTLAPARARPSPMPQFAVRDERDVAAQIGHWQHGAGLSEAQTQRERGGSQESEDDRGSEVSVVGPKVGDHRADEVQDHADRSCDAEHRYPEADDQAGGSCDLG